MSTNRYIALNGGVQTEVVPATVGGAGNAGQIVALNSGGTIDTTMLPAGVGADAVSCVTSAAISAGQMVSLYDNAGTLTARPADCTAVGSEANAFATAAVASSATGVFTMSGIVTGLSSLNPGTTYFLSTVGAVTTTPPATAGNVVQTVGKALSATSLQFNPSPVTVLA